MWSGSLRDRAGLAIAAAVAAGLVAVGTSRGAGLSPDSIAYVSAARSLAAGEGLTLWSGEPLVDWPPLYPTVLAGFAWLGWDPATAARGVAVLSHVTMVLIGGLWLRNRTRAPSVAWAGLAALTMAPAVLWTALWAWSETLFMTLCLASLVLVDRFARSGGWAVLLAAAGLAGAAALTRYVGVAVIGTGAVYVLWSGRRRLARGLVHAAAFGLVASAPLLAWLARNQAMTGTLVGQRTPGHWTLGFNVGRVLAYLSTWALPLAGEGAWLTIAWAGLVALIGWALWSGLRATRGHRAEGTAPYPGPSGAGLLVLFVLTYLALVVWSASTVALDVIDDRLLAPAFPATALAVALLADRGLWTARGPEKAHPTVLGAAFALWFVLSVPVSAEILGAGAAGQGYRSPGWWSSELVAHLRDHPPAGRIFSNDAPGVYHETGLPARWGPRRHVYASPQTTPDDITPLEELRASGAEVTLVWFDRAPPYFMSHAELAAALDLEPVAVMEGGAVVRMR